MDAELEFAIQPNTTGKQLFDQVSFNLMKYATFDTIVCMLLHFLLCFSIPLLIVQRCSTGVFTVSIQVS